MSAKLAVALLAAVIAAPALAADYAPLNCAKAANPAERTICNNYALGQDEARMATLYAVDTSLVAMGQRGDIGDAQLAWLKQRAACGRSVACLSKAYRKRIGELETTFRDIASHGPF
jgi:uncharacterized protein